MKDSLIKNEITGSVLWLELFATPIYFYPWCVTITGSALGALFLSYSVTKTQALIEGDEDPFDATKVNPALAPEDAWFAAPVADVQANTGMSKAEQGRVKKELKKLGLLHERKCGLPAKTEYRLNMPLLMQKLEQHFASKQGTWH